ncbi:hypothetical protein W97_02643 [Coniosporium apollinis CBS 100218]|uniref:F-box domain-containing protein n=1 Tax=Coniosporium apollinis (strain CBS 100218) TaxID=1168221 RepID=R7YP12_CONA1|nr:uncharacterized protein W97_02643 [Coniosporium apollinis CBS 100218]EON63416.1 hypothetical protein W97_02643 [Coniosporium apollinis CBS 100218]
MDRLSLEILAIIVSYLNPSDFIEYVSVSRQWQFAIERYTFRSLRLKSDDYDFFTRVCSDSHRAAAIAELEYDVILPAYSDEQCAKFESEKDEKANNEAFTNAIKRLFETLHLWGNPSNDGAHKMRGRPIMLSLGAYSTTDPRYREAKF